MTNNISDTTALRPPFNPEACIRTRVSNDLAIVRVTIAAAFACLAGLRWQSSVWRWPVVYGGLTIVAWTAYTHLFSTDPLVKTFYAIAGGKEAFEKLPCIDLTDGPLEASCLVEAIAKQSYGKRFPPIARAQTEDGRQVLIVERSIDPGEVDGAVGLYGEISNIRKYPMKRVFAFVERFASIDQHGTHMTWRIWGVFKELIANHPDNSMSMSLEIGVVNRTVDLDEEWFGKKMDPSAYVVERDEVGTVDEEDDDRQKANTQRVDEALAQKMGIRTMKEAESDLSEVRREEVVIAKGVPKKLIRQCSYVTVAGSLSGKVANEIHALLHPASAGAST